MATENTKKVPAAPKKERAGLGEYLKGVKLEMKKVIWPTKKELINIDTISEVYPHIRDGQMVCRIVFVNGEDVTALHTYEDIKAALKQYYK